MSVVQASACVATMQAAVNSVTALAGKSVFIYGDEDLMNKIQSLKVYPAVGIVYEGIHSVPSEGSSFKVGMSGLLVISLILIEQGESIIITDQKKTNALLYLDSIRQTLMATRSPTGHFWQFLVEAPAELKKGMVFWTQRWATPVQLSPQPPR